MADRRDLHSFPTRRSSDLHHQGGLQAAGLGVMDPFVHATALRYYSHSRRIGRSEEHTSELQSRGHLVCRLLLEKKKNQVSIARTQARCTDYDALTGDTR